MENKKYNKKVLNLSNIEDITAYEFGEYITTGSRWVNYGRTNDYPSFLRNLYLNSPTNQAVIDGTVNMATGDGIEVLDPINNPISNKWINKYFPKDVIKKLLSDLKLYGFCVMEVYGGELVKYREAIKYRFDPIDKNGEINYMWYSNDWDFYTLRRNIPNKVPIYREGCDYDVSVAIIQMDKKGYDYYSPVDYNGSINYISLESEISKYHLSNIKNGLFPSFLINFIGTEYSDEQMNQIEMDINKKFGGSSNSGRAIIGFSASKDDATVLQTIDQPNIDQTYTFLSKECSEKILCGHGVTSPIIFGIRDSGGGLGNNAQELEQSYYLYYESKLKHYQNYIIQLIKKIMNGNLLYADIAFKTHNPFHNTKDNTTLSKYEPINEVESQSVLNEIDKYKIKTNDILINEKLFDGILNGKSLYKFVKSSNNNNIINKKFEILSNKDYVFTPNDLIKNTKDYYWMEQTYMKKLN